MKKLILTLLICSCGPMEPVETTSIPTTSQATSSSESSGSSSSGEQIPTTSPTSGDPTGDIPTTRTTGDSESSTGCEPSLKGFDNCSEDCECESGFCKVFAGIGFCSRSCPPFGDECAESQICVNDGEFCAVDCKRDPASCDVIPGFKCAEIFNGSVCLPAE